MDDRFDEQQASECMHRISTWVLKLNFAGAIISAFMNKHGQTDALPAGGHYVTDDFSVSRDRDAFSLAALTTFQSIEFTVQPDVYPTYTVFRLIAEDEDDGDDVTEVTFFVVAVLAQKLFPPFKPRKYVLSRCV